jgi:hypothetical protein
MNKLIAGRQAITCVLAEMAIEFESGRLVRCLAPWLINQGEKNIYYTTTPEALASDIVYTAGTDAV